MAVASSSVPREATWLNARLKTLNPPLPVYRDLAKMGVPRCIVYRRQGGVDLSNLYDTYMVRSVWLVYVSQIASGANVYAEHLQDDADRMHEAINKPDSTIVNGRIIGECRRDAEHWMPVYDGTTLTEIQLGGVYIVLTSVA